VERVGIGGGAATFSHFIANTDLSYNEFQTNGNGTD